MAYILYTDGTRELRSEAEAQKLWLVKVGRAKPQTPAQRAKVQYIRKHVKLVKLNYRTAPEDYIRANLADIIPQVLATWLVDWRGRPVRPATRADFEFAIKYGLWRGGRPTSLVKTKGKNKVEAQLALALA